MKKIGNHTWLIIIVFVISRIILRFFDIHFQYDILLKYWQYLDVATLKHNLLKGVWYDHAQPPFFNLFLGTVLKIAGSHADYVFAILFKLITLVNCLLLYGLVKKLTGHAKLALILSLLFLLSPASLILENELFYTTFISMLFLISCHFLVGFNEGIDWKKALGFFLPLAIICLTRSMYHLYWLLLILVIALIYCRKNTGFSKLVVAGMLSLLLVGSWYVKNYFIFGKFSASTWIGMNLARNVFHDDPITDSSRIEAFEPFSRVSMYYPFISKTYEKKYAGLNDLDLLPEYKNLPYSDTLLNMNNIDYIEVSDKYLEVSKKRILSHPVNYLKNVLQSSVIFFAPATRYPSIEKEAKKISYYDVIYSFNVSHFAKGFYQRRVALTISAIPKILIYFFVFFSLARNVIRTRQISLLNLFIITTIAYVFVVSSFVEHYENMRFRFEVEPMFILLLGQIIYHFLNKKKTSGQPSQK